jgi:P2-related tail formation protein
MLKYLNDLDTKKPKLNNLAMLPGFNIIEQAKTKDNFKNDTFNNDTSNKTIVSENMFTKLYGLIDNVKKQFTRKNHKKAQAQAIKVNAIKVNAIKAKATTSTNRKHAKAENTNKSRKKSA